jgi:hypothetical protein
VGEAEALVAVTVQKAVSLIPRRNWWRRPITALAVLAGNSRTRRRPTPPTRSPWVRHPWRSRL